MMWSGDGFLVDIFEVAQKNSRRTRVIPFAAPDSRELPDSLMQCYT